MNFNTYFNTVLICSILMAMPSAHAFTHGSPSPDIIAQFRNPSDILSVLMIIGGDIVQKALAQVTGHGSSSVCFSFGWVSYSLLSLSNILGDGRLMPQPDIPCKLINMKSGHPRENKNWMIGRLLRDNELFLSDRHKSLRSEPALQISVFTSMPLPIPSHPKLALLRGLFFVPMEVFKHRITFSGFVYIAVLSAQIGIACIPWALYSDWSTLLITLFGTYMASLTTRLPQWKAEKFACRCKSTKKVAITAGNGSKDIMIIKGLGKSPDLEDLAGAESPRSRRQWEQWGIFTGKPSHSEDSNKRVFTFHGLPLDFWFTRIFCGLLSIFWIALLILVAGLKSNAWFLLIIGGLGMFQNAFVAGSSFDPQEQPIPLLHTDTIVGSNVLDALMDLEIALGDPVKTTSTACKPAVQPLLNEFFPNGIRTDDGGDDWWRGQRKQYDDKRNAESTTRGTPRSIQQDLKFGRALGRKDSIT